MNRFVILGIHGKDVQTVEGNVARVRMFIGNKEIDEDFNLPELPPSVEPTTEVYTFFLKPKIEAKMAELEGKK